MALPTRPGLLRRTLLTGLLLAGLLTLSAADARPPLVRPDTYDYSVTLEDSAGDTLPTFWHEGQRFVLGHYGERYAVRIRNHSARRVEAVLSVDGRDAVSGRRGDYATQRGYLLEPYGSVLVTGFRRSLDEVATFRFTSPSDSYSARMGTPENVGIVGVAFFPEKQWYRERPLPLAEDERRPMSRKGRAPRPSAPGKPSGTASRNSESAPSAAPRSRSEGASAPRDAYSEGASDGSRDHLGTSYGEYRDSHVTEVPFERQDRRRPSTLITLRYDDEEGLRSRGIRVDPDPPSWGWRDREPQAFPDSRFAPPPP
jgi:hypothetical protein